MLGKALRIERSRALPYAMDLAIGLQLSSIARDCLTEAARGRCYVPVRRLAPHELTPLRIIQERDDPEVRQRLRPALEGLLRLGDHYYRSAEAGAADGETDGTKLFAALSSTLADVPPDRVAGAVLITDGRVHDVPADASALGFSAPLHALVTGHKDEIDRRIVLTQTPRFGIVGQSQTIGFRVEDQGAKIGAAEVTVGDRDRARPEHDPRARLRDPHALGDELPRRDLGDGGRLAASETSQERQSDVRGAHGHSL